MGRSSRKGEIEAEDQSKIGIIQIIKFRLCRVGIGPTIVNT